MNDYLNLSQVNILGNGEIEHKSHFIINEGPTLDHTKNVRLANEVANRKGWSDGREIKFNAQIHPLTLWVVENMGCPCDSCRGRVWNLNDVKEYRTFFTIHPEYLVAPINTKGASTSGLIIVK